MPGTQLGTFKVTGQSSTNSCGLGAPNPWTFDVQLSQSGSTVYWSWMDGSALLSGPVSSQSHASIQDSVAGNVDGTDAALGPCTLDRSDDLELDLTSDSFTGTVSYSFTPSAGASCGDQLTASGGSFEALPCTVTYSVTAAKQ
ncbi:MAG TPA: hypothetical protein VGL81_31125 [Polyangiaceae bacterium]|jgi:hypothetical protein